MRLDRLHLHDFRNYASAEVAFAPGLTALLGRNGQGKTNLLEAVAYLATLRSFRSAGGEVLVRSGTERAVVRAEGQRRDGRDVLIEAEVARSGRHRAQLNRQRLSRPADLVGVATVTVFTPEDLAVVKEGPQLRRDLLDGVEVTPGDEVVISTLDALKPAVIRSTDGGDFLYLLMPVRVS